MPGIPSYAPASRLTGVVAAQGDCRGYHVIGRVGRRSKPRARGTGVGPLSLEVTRAHLAAAVHAGSKMILTGKAPARRARRGSYLSELTSIDVTGRPMGVARHCLRPVADALKVRRAVSLSIDDADAGMMVANRQTARFTTKYFVGRENSIWLERARGAILLADEAPRAIGTSQVPGTVNLTVDGAPRLVLLAYDPIAARAVRDLIRSDDLTGSPFAPSHAFATESALAKGRSRSGSACVGLANDTPAIRTWRQACRARGVTALLAHAFVRGAVTTIARRACPRVRVARRCSIDMAYHAVVAAERSVTDGALRGACVAADVIVDAHGERRGRCSATARATQRPARIAGKQSLTRE